MQPNGIISRSNSTSQKLETASGNQLSYKNLLNKNSHVVKSFRFSVAVWSNCVSYLFYTPIPDSWTSLTNSPRNIYWCLMRKQSFLVSGFFLCPNTNIFLTICLKQVFVKNTLFVPFWIPYLGLVQPWVA